MQLFCKVIGRNLEERSVMDARLATALVLALYGIRLILAAL